MERAVARFLEYLKARVALVAQRCLLKLTDDSGGRQLVQVGGLAGETLGPLERFQQYGLSSSAPPGSEGVVVFLAGARSHGAVLVLEDRSARPRGLQPGEVAVYDDLGRVVVFARDGLRVDGASSPVTLVSSVKVRIEAPLTELTGDLTVQGNATVDGDVSDASGTAQTMAEMRATFDEHTHQFGGVTPGPTYAPTAVPNPPLMG